MNELEKIVFYIRQKHSKIRKVSKIYRNSPSLIITANSLLSFLLGVSTITFISISILNFLLIKNLKYFFLSIVVMSCTFSIIVIQTNTTNNHFDNVVGNKNQLNGIVIEPIDQSEYSSSTIIKLNNGLKLYLSEYSLGELEFGDYILFEAEIERIENPSEGFDLYLYSKGISGRISNFKLLQTEDKRSITTFLYKIRKDIENKYNENLSPRSAGYISGITVGTKSNLSQQLETDLQRTGTTHIISASGFNVALVYLGVSLILKFLVGFKSRLIFSLLAVWIYVGIVGFYNIPALRAGIMISIILTGRFFGRKVNIFIALMQSSLILLTLNPNVYMNISFQLSFLAVLGIITFNKSLTSLFNKFFKNGYVAEAVSISTSASILTTPIVSFSFGGISTLSLLTNLIISPLVPASTLVAIIALLATNLDFLNQAIFLVLESTSNFTLEILNIISRIGIAYSENTDVIYLYTLSLFCLALISDYYVFRQKYQIN